MKKSLALLLMGGCLLIMISCEKRTSSSSAYYMNASFDGSPKQFNTAIIPAKSKLADPVYSLVISGLTTSDQCAVTLWSDKDDFMPGNCYNINSSGSKKIL